MFISTGDCHQALTLPQIDFICAILFYTYIIHIHQLCNSSWAAMSCQLQRGTLAETSIEKLMGLIGHHHEEDKCTICQRLNCTSKWVSLAQGNGINEKHFSNSIPVLSDSPPALLISFSIWIFTVHTQPLSAALCKYLLQCMQMNSRVELCLNMLLGPHK